MQLTNPKYGKLNDFRNFLIVTWSFLKLPLPDDVQIDIAHYLQTGPDRLVIEAFRGVGKTWITAAFVCWCLMLNPDLKILIVSKTKDKALEISQFIRKLLREHPLLKHMNPDSGDNQGQNTMQRFDVVGCNIAVAPSVKAEGIEGQITGSRANIVIADDVETPKNSMTQTEREKLEGLVKEFDAVLSPGGRILYLGTPQTEQTLYSKLEKKGYELRVWPIRYPSGEQLKSPAYFGRLAPMVKNNWREPLAWKPLGIPRFPEADILAREAQGRSWFMLQYMLDPTLSDEDRYPLKLRDLIVLSLNKETAPVQLDYAATPQTLIKDQDLPAVGFDGDRYYGPFHIAQVAWQPYDFICMGIDPSGRGGDETAYAVLGFLKGKMYLLASGGFTGGYADETLESLAKVARDYNVGKVLIESNFGDGMFLKLMTPVMARYAQVSMEEIRVTGQKEARLIDMLEPVLNQHRLVVCPSVIRKDYSTDEKRQAYQLFYQLTRLTRDRGSLRHDDRLDALYLAVKFCLDAMAQDDTTSEADFRQRALQDKLDRFGRKFSQGIFGRGAEPRAGSWISHR